jgi:uncharacterized membrane protein YhaH (DUF805 family)
MMSVAALMLFQEEPQIPSAAAQGMGIGMIVLWLAVVILMIAAMWKIFEKAGKPGWAALVPIYNLVVLCEIAGKPAWWVVLMLIPLVNIVVAIIVVLAVAKNFGKSGGFGIGLLLLGPIFYPMLAWGDAQYQPQP